MEKKKKDAYSFRSLCRTTPTAILLCFDTQRLNIFFLRHHLEFDAVSVVEKNVYQGSVEILDSNKSKMRLWGFLYCKIIQFLVTCLKSCEIDEHCLQMKSIKFLVKTQILKWQNVNLILTVMYSFVIV